MDLLAKVKAQLERSLYFSKFKMFTDIRQRGRERERNTDAREIH